MRDDNGLFIVFDGIDGSGKSSLAEMLVSKLCHDMIKPHSVILNPTNIILTHEPTDSEWGEKIRIVANTRAENDSNTLMELRNLFEQDRSLHVEKVIKPALNEGKIVICDRYYHSTVAYQGAMYNPNDPRGMPSGLDPRRILEESMARHPVPDLVFIIDAVPRVALSRIALERPKVKLFEQEAYLELVAFKFKNILDSNIAHIDGIDTLDRMFEKVWSSVEPVLKVWESEG